MAVRKMSLYALSGFVAISFLLLFGCSHFRDLDNEIVSNSTGPGKLHRIKPLEPEKTEEEEVLRFDSEKPAPAELSLTLEECRANVLENNLDLKVQLIAPAIAAESVSEAEAKFEATFTADSTVSKTNMPMASYLETEGDKRDTINTTLGIGLPLRTGGRINVYLTDISNETDSEYTVYNPTYTNQLSASISQPLLRGAGRRASEYAIRIAELNRQIVDAQTRLKVIYAIAESDKAYWELYKARKLLEVQRKHYELKMASLDEIEKLVEVGSRARIEVIRIRASVANDVKAIITAENNVRDRERGLKQLLNKPGLGINTETVLIPSTRPNPVRYNLQREKMMSNALENRMDLLEEELKLISNSSDIDYNKNQNLPLVDLWYRYNINGLGPSRSDAYDLLADNTYNDHSVGLQVSIPLGNKAVESRLRQAIYRRSQQLAIRENKKQLIIYEVLRQVDRLDADWQGILASRQATLLNDEEYQAEKRRFELGMATSREVLEAQTNLAEAQKDEINAITDYQISLIDLAYYTGTLLGAAKVQWEPAVQAE
jgi:outer membrane protein TolC